MTHLELIRGHGFFSHSVPGSVGPSASLSHQRCPYAAGHRRPMLFNSATMPHFGFAALAGCRFRRINCSLGKCLSGTESQSCKGDLEGHLHVQTLKDFPVQELLGKIVLVRFDAGVLLHGTLDIVTESLKKALYTINYLYDAGSKILLASNWGRLNYNDYLSTQSAADYLSSVLDLKVVPAKSQREEIVNADIILLENLAEYREELANCSAFSQTLSSGVDIFVNDSFCLSHKILSSTVGVTRFCDACLAGFQFELELSQAKEITESSKQPYIAIIGGGNLSQKATAIHHLASICDGLVFVGSMTFQIMDALGFHVPQGLVKPSESGLALEIIQLAHNRKIPILVPKEFYCYSNSSNKSLAIVSVQELLKGWTPVDIGPSFINEIISLISNCKKILWIGPVGFDSSRLDISGAQLALMLENVCGSSCDVTVVGPAACKALVEKSSFPVEYNLIRNVAVIWEFLKRRTLPGVAALDKTYPSKVAWDAVFADPTQPLVVDIGSGNGLFLLKMATTWKNINFLGLEINKKLVVRCMDSVHRSGIKNGHFISTNATSTFRSIVSSYPGELVLASILCPNPDFNKIEHRWRILQKGLVEAVADLLVNGGMVFLQSDVKAVAERMKEQFLLYGKGKFAISTDGNHLKIDTQWWLEENPFGIHTDWEQHVIDRGAPMFRLMLSKVDSEVDDLKTPNCLRSMMTVAMY